MPSENGHHDWFVLVKIKDQETMGQTELEWAAKDAIEVLPAHTFESAHIVMADGYGKYVRPRWATDHKIG